MGKAILQMPRSVWLPRRCIVRMDFFAFARGIHQDGIDDCRSVLTLVVDRVAVHPREQIQQLKADTGAKHGKATPEVFTQLRFPAQHPGGLSVPCDHGWRGKLYVLGVVREDTFEITRVPEVPKA